MGSDPRSTRDRFRRRRFLFFPIRRSVNKGAARTRILSRLSTKERGLSTVLDLRNQEINPNLERRDETLPA